MSEGIPAAARFSSCASGSGGTFGQDAAVDVWDLGRGPRASRRSRGRSSPVEASDRSDTPGAVRLVGSSDERGSMARPRYSLESSSSAQLRSARSDSACRDPLGSSPGNAGK